MEDVSDDGILELIVPRMKLRMRYSDSTATSVRFDDDVVIFNLRFIRTLLFVDGIDMINQSHNYPLQTCSVPIQLPLSCGRRMTAMIDALREMNVAEEFRQDITTHVLNYIASSGHTNSSFSIDVDIKVVSSSYLVCEEEAFDWSYVEDENKMMTRSLFVHEDDKDYSIVLMCPIRSYGKLPCGNLCHVKAIAYSCNDVTEAERCSVCLDDFLPCNDESSSSVLMMTICHHLFHQQCIVSWLTRKNASATCPLCRETIQIYD